MKKPEGKLPSLCLNGCPDLIEIEGHDKIRISSEGQYTRYTMYFCSQCGVVRMIARRPSFDSTGTIIHS